MNSDIYNKVFNFLDVFVINIGVSCDLNKLEIDTNGINYIGRTKDNNGLTAKVKNKKGLKIYNGKVITIPMVGNSTLLCSYQSEDFCVSQNIAILKLKNFELNEYIAFYLIPLIEKEKYRFNYGRTLSLERIINLKIKLPAKSQSEVAWNVVEQHSRDILARNSIDNLSVFEENIITCENIFKEHKYKWFSYGSLFQIERGKGARIVEITESGKYPVVTSIDKNNGYSGWTNNKPPHKANVISVNRNGSVGEAFYQPIAFCSTEDVHIFNPRFKLNPYIALFLTTLIRKEKYRFNYGRKWGLGRMNESKIKLPVKDDGNPDWEFMENYIKSLSYSKYLQ